MSLLGCGTVIAQVVPDISKGHTTFIFRVRQLTAWPWRCRPEISLQRQQHFSLSPQLHCFFNPHVYCTLFRLWPWYLYLVISEECVRLYSHSLIYVVVVCAIITCTHLPVTTSWWDQRLHWLQCGFVLIGCGDYTAANNEWMIMNVSQAGQERNSVYFNVS